MKLLLFSIVLSCNIAYSQQCSYFPADCPETGDIEAAQDSDACIGNLLVPQEITLQNNLRNRLTSMMEELAKEKNWRVYEFTEEAGGGAGANGVATPYALRPPHPFTISFDFIINEDSLTAWHNWYYNDLKNASDRVVDSYRQSADKFNDGSSQAYSDSATYYADQKTKYAADHAQEYQKAILGGDVKGQKKYEAAMQRLDDRINSFINKANNNTTTLLSRPKSQSNNLQAFKQKNTIAFRNGSVLRVTLNVNDYIAIADDEEKKVTKQLSQPGAVLGLLMHNDSPDEHETFGQFNRSPDVIMLLFGKWLPGKDQYHAYHPQFFGDRRNTDALTVKKIPCDKVQTIVLHLEGGPRHMAEFLESFDTQKLSSLIVKE